jgi:hypothetical protein
MHGVLRQARRLAQDDKREDDAQRDAGTAFTCICGIVTNSYPSDLYFVIKRVVANTV